MYKNLEIKNNMPLSKLIKTRICEAMFSQLNEFMSLSNPKENVHNDFIYRLSVASNAPNLIINTIEKYKFSIMQGMEKEKEWLPVGYTTKEILEYFKTAIVKLCSEEKEFFSLAEEYVICESSLSQNDKMMTKEYDKFEQGSPFIYLLEYCDEHNLPTKEEFIQEIMIYIKENVEVIMHQDFVDEGKLLLPESGYYMSFIKTLMTPKIIIDDFFADKDYDVLKTQIINNEEDFERYE